MALNVRFKASESEVLPYLFNNTQFSRLARSALFTATLMEEKVQFKACDNPNADEFTINILASVSQKAAKDISEATKRGLLAKKAWGFTLGNPGNFTAAGRELGRTRRIENAREALPNKQACRLAGLLRRTGATLAAIADELNGHGYRTRRGTRHRPSSVHRLLAAGRAHKKPAATDAT